MQLALMIKLYNLHSDELGTLYREALFLDSKRLLPDEDRATLLAAHQKLRSLRGLIDQRLAEERSRGLRLAAWRCFWNEFTAPWRKCVFGFPIAMSYAAGMELLDWQARKIQEIAMKENRWVKAVPVGRSGIRLVKGSAGRIPQ